MTNIFETLFFQLSLISFIVGCLILGLSILVSSNMIGQKIVGYTANYVTEQKIMKLLLIITFAWFCVLLCVFIYGINKVWPFIYSALYGECFFYLVKKF